MTNEEYNDCSMAVGDRDMYEEVSATSDAREALTEVESPLMSSASESSSSSATVTTKVDSDRDIDPFNIRERFIITQKAHFPRALREIENGEKKSCWFWFVLPTPPYVVNGVEKGSSANRRFALRSDDEVIAYLSTSGEGVNLRNNYLIMLGAIERKLAGGSTLRQLLGSLDHVKAVKSFQLFEKTAMLMEDEELYVVCRKVLKLSDKGSGWKKAKKWIVPFRSPTNHRFPQPTLYDA